MFASQIQVLVANLCLEILFPLFFLLSSFFFSFLSSVFLSSLENSSFSFFFYSLRFPIFFHQHSAYEWKEGNSEGKKNGRGGGAEKWSFFIKIYLKYRLSSGPFLTRSEDGVARWLLLLSLTTVTVLHGYIL